MIFLLYGINLLVAIPLALAFRATLVTGFGQSMDSANLMQGLDLSVVQEFLNLHRDGISALLQQVTWLLLAYMILNTFLAGGVLTVVQARNDRFSAVAFSGGCGRYFLRFLRLFIITGVVLILVILLFGLVLGAILSAVIESASSEVTDILARAVALLLVLPPVMLVVMIADYAKIVVVVQDERSMLKTAWWSTKLVFRNFFKVFGLELLMVPVPVILFGAYMAIDLTIGMDSGPAIAVMFVVQQVFILSKAWTKVFFFGGELSLYHSLQPFGAQLAAAPPGAMPGGTTTV
jgi:hypothetical protein